MQADESLLYRMLGRNLRRRREELGLSQAVIAQRVGVARTTITNIESAEQHPPLHTLYAICAELDVELAAMLPTREELSRLSTITTIVGEGEIREVPPKTTEVLQELIADQLAGRKRRHAHDVESGGPGDSEREEE